LRISRVAHVLVHDGLNDGGVELLRRTTQGLGHSSNPSLFLAYGIRSTHGDLARDEGSWRQRLGKKGQQGRGGGGGRSGAGGSAHTLFKDDTRGLC
jgi:hypothetical protein